MCDHIFFPTSLSLLYHLACSRLRDSGERAKRKRGRKNARGQAPARIIFAFPLCSRRHLLSESLEQAIYHLSLSVCARDCPAPPPHPPPPRKKNFGCLFLHRGCVIIAIAVRFKTGHSSRRPPPPPPPALLP